MTLPSKSHRGFRSQVWPWLCAGILLVMLVSVSETFLVLGIFTPVVIEGSSMAPTLLGPHIDIACPHCQWKFAVGVDELPTTGKLSCPDCQRPLTIELEQRAHRGERMWIDRTRFALRTARRWDVVVFRCPTNSNSYCIKRIVGQQGEHVDFAAGDLVIDGQLIRKSLADQLRTRQLVHLERNKQQQWHTDSATWNWSTDSWRHAGLASALRFVPAGDSPITDARPASRLSMPRTHVVSDLMVTCRAKLDADATLSFVGTWDDGSQVRSPSITKSSAELVWSLFDRQSLVAVNEAEIESSPLTDAQRGVPQLTFECTGDVEIRDLRVWRDAYYHTRGVDRWPANGVQLGPEEFLVLGDNLAISDDSRSWPNPGLNLRQLIGVPIFLHPVPRGE